MKNLFYRVLLVVISVSTGLQGDAPIWDDFFEKKAPAEARKQLESLGQANHKLIACASGACDTERDSAKELILKVTKDKVKSLEKDSDVALMNKNYALYKGCLKSKCPELYVQVQELEKKIKEAGIVIGSSDLFVSSPARAIDFMLGFGLIVEYLSTPPTYGVQER